MWIVNIALRRPYTFLVAALLILLATPYVLRNTPTDIFPEVDIPVVSIVWSYSGLSAQEMAARIVTPVERNLTTTVNNIEHIESQSLGGIGMIKVFFQPGADISTSLTQIVASTNWSMRSLPAGITPPIIIKYSAASLPILQIGLGSTTLSDTEVSDLAFNTLRPKLVTIPGVAVPAPYGGKSRLIAVDVNGGALKARGLTAVDVVNAISAQNLTLPTGTAKIGETEYNVALNGAPRTLAQIGEIPIRTVNGATTYVRDVAQVRDGAGPPTNIVRQDGERGVLVSLLKNGGASTLDIVSDALAVLPKAAESMPAELKITTLFDQSLFVKAAIHSVVVEGLIAALLTALMILLFLGNWRSTAIIALSIPLSILSSLLLLHISGQTINLMTLGGLALAVGILVDDATVTIENIERHQHLGKAPVQAIRDGAAEIATPTFVATLCICIVFVPMFFLTGVARFLFVPLALAVVYAMLASWVLSRTLVPTLALLLTPRHGKPAKPPGRWMRIHLAFDAGFTRLRDGYATVLASVLQHRRAFGGVFLGFCLLSGALYGVLGRDFFPVVDAGQLRLHVRAPAGTRLEEMPRLIDRIEAQIRRAIPPDEIKTVLDNIGGPYTPVNTVYNNAGTIDSSDAEILISLVPGKRGNTRDYIAALRAELPRSFPGVEFFFQPADMVSQTLNFGLPAPINIQFIGNKVSENHALASELVQRIRQVPGAVDVLIYQRMNRPVLALEVDRTRLQHVGLTMRDVAQNIMIPLSSSFQTAPTYWLNPQNGNTYTLAVQQRQHELDSIDSLLQLPIGNGDSQQLLGNLATVQPAAQQSVVSRYDIAPVIDIYVSVQGRDLAAVYADIEPLLKELGTRIPKGTDLKVRGQVSTMHSSFVGLGIGLAVAIVLVYLLIVVNFQSWLDPLIIITALPAALAGIAWLLFLTGTPLSVPALTGAIMTVGVATANSILMVSFARERLAAGVPPVYAALEAGITRLRPVLMTAAAMIVGMIPMALGLGDGGEQNAPLGRAVIGGLLFATLSTLLFVPVVFAAVHRRLQLRTHGADAHRHTPSHPSPHPGLPGFSVSV
ncbi:Multidrug resistance protein MdtC [Andreprevotia sp. IGB-42]|uniref:efflux RND transporter permease subunit n=1 Tax=Andreprevotia sp. IGB-42 TaxID=2497473 RepID=UPI00135B75F5|nr:efflux RND transporter permease subunit [Andreprevotia sp. IGB-42]KAF0813636.1 Multidrug resistance protein MdtC [Andreprevotia sp. IGB-42]